MDEEQTKAGGGKGRTAVRITWKIVRDYLTPALYFIAKHVGIALWWFLKQLWHVAKTYMFPLAKRSYARIPRKIAIGIALFPAIGVAILVSWLFANSDLSREANPPNPKAWKEQGLVASSMLDGTWEEQRQAMRETLRSVGFEVMDGADFPTDDASFILPPELTLLADDASRKATGGRLSLVQFVQMLRSLGFPFAEDRDPVASMQSGLRKWVIAAASDPKQEGAAAPLFLQAMALKQSPAIDLTAEDWDPTAYRLTYVEMQVFLGAFLQAARPERSADIGLLDSMLGTRIAAAADDLSACSYAKKWFGDLGEKNDVSGITKFNIELISILATELTGKAIDALGSVISAAMTAISASMKIMKLGMLYWSTEVTVVPSEESIHKPLGNEPDMDVTYTAKVGVDEKKYKEYVEGWEATPLAKQVKDCLSFAGIPTPTDLGDISADVENWSVEWDLVQGGGKHALIGLDKNAFDFKGQFQMKLKRADKISGEAKLVTDITPEKVSKHEGFEWVDVVRVRAVVETSSPPGIGTLLSSGKAGAGAADSGAFDVLALSDAMLDVAAGWFQEMAEPEAYGTTLVKYHAERSPEYRYVGWISAELHVNRESEEKWVDEWGEESRETKESKTEEYYGRWNAEFAFSDAPSPNQYYMRMSDSPGSIQSAASSQSYFKHENSRVCVKGGTWVETRIEAGAGSNRDDSSIGGTLFLYESPNPKDKGKITYDLGVYDAYVEGEYHIRGTHQLKIIGTCGAYYDDDAFTEPTESTGMYQGTLQGFKVIQEIPEQFPKTINGSYRSKDPVHEDRITNWSWSLKRVDPN